MEEENEEISEEQIRKNNEKAKKIGKKIHDFMAEVSVEMMDDETMEAGKKSFVNRFKTMGIPMSSSHLKAMREGLQAAIGAAANDSMFPLYLVAIISKMISDADTSKKVDEAMKDFTDKTSK